MERYAPHLKDLAPCDIVSRSIFAEDDLPSTERDYIEINSQLSKLWPIITAKKEPALTDEDLIPVEHRVVTLSQEGYVKSQSFKQLPSAASRRPRQISGSRERAGLG